MEIGEFEWREIGKLEWQEIEQREPAWWELELPVLYLRVSESAR